jgi:Fe-S cluster assembly iron-binding protein IscA
VALDEPKQNEKSTSIDGVEILIDEAARPFFEGAKVDYGKSWFKEGFTVSSAGLSC